MSSLSDIIKSDLAKAREEGRLSPPQVNLLDTIAAETPQASITAKPDITFAPINVGEPKSPPTLSQGAGLFGGDIPQLNKIGGDPNPQGTIGLNPNQGLLPESFNALDPTRGLFQFNQDFNLSDALSNAFDFKSSTPEERKVRMAKDIADRDGGLAGKAKNSGRTILETAFDAKSSDNPIIMYGPKAGVLVSAIQPILNLGTLAGIPGKELQIPKQLVRPEGQQSRVGEFVGEAVGIGTVIALTKNIGTTVGLSGAYAWTAGSVVESTTRRFGRGKSLGEVVSDPWYYVEASLGGSPFFAKAVLKQAARPLSRLIKRPLRFVSGKSFFPTGKILRTGEVPSGKGIVDQFGNDIISAKELFKSSDDPIGSELFNLARKFSRENLPKLHDKAAVFLDNTAAAESFLQTMNDGKNNLIEGYGKKKDAFIGASKFLWQAQNLGKSKEFKSSVEMIREAMEKEHLYAGMFLEDLRIAGIKNFDGKSIIEGTNIKNDGNALKSLLEFDDIKVTEFRNILNKVHKFAGDKGVDVSGYRAGYFPRMMKTKISMKLADDIQFILDNAGKKRAISELDVVLSPTDVDKLSEISLRFASKNKNRPLSKALKHIIDDKTNNINTYSDAFFYLKEQSFDDLFNPFGNIERARILNLPAGFYETDAKKILPRYIRGVAKRAATVEVFGKDGKKMSGLLKKMHSVNPDEAETAKRILDSWTGRINSQHLNTKIGRRFKAFLEASQTFEVITKIGFGLATIPNMTQVGVSSALEAGWLRSIKAGYKALNPVFRSEIRRSGVLLDTAQDALLGYSEDGIWNTFRDISLKASGFSQINNVNQYWSAAIGKEYLQDLYVLGNRKIEGAIAGPPNTKDLSGTLIDASIPKIRDARTQWARTKLLEKGIDYRSGLSQETISRFMFRFANETQLQKNVLREPLTANDPRFRWMFLFKKFGLKQAQLINERAIREVRVNGNPMPLLRLGVGGYLGGEFVEFSKNKISSFLSGEAYYRDSEAGTWERMINNFGAVGGFGVMGDLTKTLSQPLLFEEKLESNDIKRLISSVKFLGAPVQVQTLGDLYQWLTVHGSQLAVEIDDPITWREKMSEFSELFGTISRRIAKRTQTPGQRRNSRQARRNNLVDDLRDLIQVQLTTNDKGRINSIEREISRKLENWNTAYPNLEITNDDISSDVVLNRLNREENRKANRMSTDEDILLRGLPK